jgi:hypothetical protein
MTDQEKAEIRTIIKEEIEAKLSNQPNTNAPKSQPELNPIPEKTKVVNIETVSPAY